jgi:hypothetical protein
VGRGVSHCGVNESSFLRCCFLDAENIDCLPRQARTKRSFAKTGSIQNTKDSLSSSHTWYAIVGNADPQEASDGCIAPSCQTVGVMSDTAPSSPCPSTIMSRNCACTVATPSTCRHKTHPLFFECFPYVCPEPVLVKCSFLYINGSKSGVFRTPGKLKLAASAEIAASPTGRNTLLLLLLLRNFCPEPAVANSWSHFFKPGKANRDFQKLRRVLLQRALTYPSSL